MSNDSSSSKNDPFFERLFAEAEACLDKNKKPDTDADEPPEVSPPGAMGLPLRSAPLPGASQTAREKPARVRNERAKPVPTGRMPLSAQAGTESEVLAIAEAKIEKLQGRLSTVKERAKRDQQLALSKQKDKMLGEFLNLLDDLERALEVRIEETDSRSQFESYKKGIQQVYDGGQQLLGQFGVQRFESVGATFDPNRHEAVRRDPRADVDPNTVCEVFQAGYTIDDRLLRAARVSVSASTS